MSGVCGSKKRNCSYCNNEFESKNYVYKCCSDKCRFLNKVEKKGDCWIWKGSYLKGGYGAHRFNGKSLGAHRTSWTLFKGEIPIGMYVCHKCDNPGCVNPDHLFLGSAEDNNRDRAKKGRSDDRHGEKHPCRKLTNETVLEIRKLWSSGMKQKEIAKIYGIDNSAVSVIVNNKRWKHIGV